MLELKCIVTGKIRKMKPNKIPKLIQRQIEKFGDFEEFQKYYICNEAKRELKAGLNVKQVREKLGITEKLPRVKDEILFKLKLKKLRKRKKKITDEQKAESQRLAREYYEYQQRMKTDFKFYVEEISKNNTCHRPDILVANKNNCHKCPYTKYCLCRYNAKNLR